MKTVNNNYVSIIAMYTLSGDRCFIKKIETTIIMNEEDRNFTIDREVVIGIDLNEMKKKKLGICKLLNAGSLKIQ